MTDATYSVLVTQASEKERSDADRARCLYQALRMLCDDVVAIHELLFKRLTSMQRAVVVVDEACEQFGIHSLQRQPLLELAMWAEAKTGFAPFQRVDDMLRMVESLAAVRAGQVGRFPEPFVIREADVAAEYVIAELPISGRTSSFYQLAKNVMEDLADTPDPEAMRLVRRARRRLLRTGKLLTSTEFCRRAGITQAKLRARARCKSIFTVGLDRKAYYPALFLRADRLRSRLARVVRAMGGMNDPWGEFFELTYAFASLGGKTLPQVLRRGSGLRTAMRYARALAGD